MRVLIYSPYMKTNQTAPLSTKSVRQLRAIRANNAPGSTAWILHPERALALHRAAYAEIRNRLS